MDLYAGTQLMRIPSWILSVRTKCHNLTRPLARPPNIPCRVCAAGLNFVNQLLRISSLELRSILLMIVRVPTSIFSKNGYDMEQCSFLPMMRMFWQLSCIIIRCNKIDEKHDTSDPKIRKGCAQLASSYT